MKHHAQLALALQSVSTGADAIRYAARAANAASRVHLSAEFAYNALTAPLSELSGLLSAVLPPPPPAPLEAASEPARPRVRRKAQRKRRPRAAELATPRPGGLPEPPDLSALEDQVSPWDPDEDTESRPYSPDADPLMESSSCRALLLEVVRRASYDWVLYRSSAKLPMRMLADNAYQWLFKENVGTPDWAERKVNGKELTGFIAICELLDLDPERVRDKVRTMTERDIMGAGRPAERRRHKTSGGGGEDVMQADDHRVFDVDVDSIPSYDPMFASSMEG